MQICVVSSAEDNHTWSSQKWVFFLKGTIDLSTVRMDCDNEVFFLKGFILISLVWFD